MTKGLPSASCMNYGLCVPEGIDGARWRGNKSSLKGAYTCLKTTGAGKHVGSFSYYHVALISRVAEAEAALSGIAELVGLGKPSYNVVKLDGKQRVSFLEYEAFDAPFPALLSAVSCNLGDARVRRIDYSNRQNPPILHRKELLLPEDHPLVGEASRLTAWLEQKGAFVGTAGIGTRLGWQRRLDDLGLDIFGRQVK